MNPRMRAEFVQALRRRRSALVKQLAHDESDLRVIAGDREPELEECAQSARAARVLARLDDRTHGEIAQIDAALRRLADRSYGTCLDCGQTIPLTRLRALPIAAFCVDCARSEEAAPPSRPEPPEPSHPGVLPPDLASLMDREVEDALRELVRDDHRIDAEELRLVCHHGIVHLDGAVPSEAEHRMLLQLVTDVAGCGDVVDRLQINELLWERPERSRREPRERLATEDVVVSEEEGLDYLAPDQPQPDEV